MEDSEIKMRLKKIALRNSIIHGGAPNLASIISNAMFDEDLKENKTKVIKLAPSVEKEVKNMSPEDQEKEAKRLEVDMEIRAKPQREGLPELPNKKPNGEMIELEGNVVTRFAPNPNAPLHLGSARPLVISGLYAKKYDGKFILRFDDTDPENKAPLKDAYGWILEDCEWLGFKPDLVVYASDRFDVYIEKAHEMYEKEGAYVCTCDPDKWKDLLSKGKACPCRDRHDEVRWNKFLHEMKPGEAVLRIKTSLGHKNPAIRDWPAIRIKPNVNHPRVDKNQRIWPLYNFASAIDDHDLGVTHIIRGQEHMANTEKQAYIFKFFKWDEPIAIHHGKLTILGLEHGSKSKIKEAVESGELTGWEDPKSGTLRSLKKMGVKPETIIKIMKKVGVRKNVATIDLANILGENKKSRK